MTLVKVHEEPTQSELTASQKRRNRRKRLKAARVISNPITEAKININQLDDLDDCLIIPNKALDTIYIEPETNTFTFNLETSFTCKGSECKELNKEKVNMSSKEEKSRQDILAAREVKKLAKLKAKGKGDAQKLGNDSDDKKDKVSAAAASAAIDPSLQQKPAAQKETVTQNPTLEKHMPKPHNKDLIKCIDEVDKAAVQDPNLELDKDKIKAERAAKKAIKQAKKKGEEAVSIATGQDKKEDVTAVAPNKEMTVKDVVETLKDIKIVAKDVQDLTAKVSAIHIEASKKVEKSKAELKAERRAKQEAQRAAKQAADEKKAAAKPKSDASQPKEATPINDAKEKSPKPKSTEKSKSKVASSNRVNWFQHLYTGQDKDNVNKIPINSNLHPAIIKLGTQLASRVVDGSNARCIALLDALKKMVRDYTLPAKTEFARGLESHLATSLSFLWSMRQPSASQANAVKYFRHHLTQLPNNVDEFDAKKTLQEEIDKYIEDQIDKAGEAISMTVRTKISTNDNILTYGCSSLIERILREAWETKRDFRTVIVGDAVHGSAREMLRRLASYGVPCTYVDITAISFVMKTINKVVLGADSLLVNGSVLGAAGTAQVALVARAYNVPVLVACETHKFSERVQTDAFVYNEIGDPDELIDKTDENSPLKDWRNIPNLTPLNLTYDVTPACLVTAVVTEKAILPCTSAPVVLRTKLSEFGI